MKLTCVARHPGVEIAGDAPPVQIKCGVCGLPLQPESLLTPLLTPKDAEHIKLAVDAAFARAAEEAEQMLLKTSSNEDGKSSGAWILMLTLASVILRGYVERHLVAILTGAPLEERPAAAVPPA